MKRAPGLVKWSQGESSMETIIRKNPTILELRESTYKSK